MENEVSPPQAVEQPAATSARPAKQFKQYFFEGLMIFLAISLGFFADNLRDSLAERKQARELASSLYKEVYKDSIELTRVLDGREIKTKKLNFFIEYVRDSSLSNISEQFLKSFAWSFMAVTPFHFDPSDGVLQQIHNANNLQLFNSVELQSEIDDLYVQTTRLRNRWDHEQDFFQSRLVPFNLNHFDYRWWTAITQDLPFLKAIDSKNSYKSKLMLRNLESFNREYAESLAHQCLAILNGTKNAYLIKYQETSHKLLNTLRKEYPAETKATRN